MKVSKSELTFFFISLGPIFSFKKKSQVYKFHVKENRKQKVGLHYFDTTGFTN